VLTAEEIKQVMRGDTSLAWDPSPADGSMPDIHLATPLSWSPGDKATEQDVYFGTDEAMNSYTEENIVNSGGQAMPFSYDNNKQSFAKYSETELTLTAPRDWTEEAVTELSLWFRGYAASVRNFVEGPVGTYTMTASGADIWAVNGVEADEFRFAYKMLSGPGSIVARIQSV